MRFSSPLLPLLFLGSVAASAPRLYSDTVSYCSTSRAVIIDSFDISYWRSNQSVTFDFSLASVRSNLNASVNLYVNVYGRQAVDTTINLCGLLDGLLCPLPQINYTGSATYPIPSSFANDIPDIAWTVPNIEGYARIELISVDTGEVVACLQTTITNGLSTRQTAVAWATAMFTLVAFIIGILHATSTHSPSPAQYRWFDILFLFQTAASTGMMHLNYPLVYSNFTQNFRWAFGLLYSSDMQSSINKMRNRTGGNLSGSVYNSSQNVNTNLSPYNLGSSSVGNGFIAFNDIIKRSPYTARGEDNGYSKRILADSFNLVSRALPTITLQNAGSDSVNGISAYVNEAGIPRANAYDTIFFIFLAFVAIILAVHVLLFLLVVIIGRRGGWAGRLRENYWNFTMGNLLRLCLIGSLPIWLFGFYQFSIGRSDSGLSIFFAVFGILLIFLPLLIVFILSTIKSRRRSSTAPTTSPLFTSWRWFHSAGALYRPYRQRYHFTWFILILAIIAKSGFIAFGNNLGAAQVIGCMVVEFLTLVYLLFSRPHKDKKGDWLGVFLSFCRLCAFGLLIAFLQELGVGAITRTIIGFVIIVLFGIPTVLLLLGLIWNAGYGYLWRRHTARTEDGLEVEKYAGSDRDSITPAMRQRQTGTFLVDGEGHRDSVNGTGDGSAPTLDRRTSMFEPVNRTYEPPTSPQHSNYGYDQGAGYRNSGYGHGHQDANEAYAAAANDGYSHGYQPDHRLSTGMNQDYAVPGSRRSRFGA